MNPTESYHSLATTSLDIEAIRQDFPILQRTINGHPLVYLDNAATSQKPQVVLDSIVGYYTSVNSNVHRGVHQLSQLSTDAFEAAREAVRRFIRAANDYEIVFTRGTTDSVNLVAGTFIPTFLGPGDEILVTEVEHHSNIVPWQIAAKRVDAVVRTVHVGQDGIVRAEQVAAELTDRTKFVAVTHVSNSLGTVNDVRSIADTVHRAGIPLLVDGAQAVPHMAVDVVALDCDFYCFSGHKMFGPTGIGVLYGKEDWLDRLPPYQGGGGMIDRVTIDGTTFGDLPHKFEAGTPDMSGAVGLQAAVEYMEFVGLDAIEAYETELVAYTSASLKSVEGLRILGADAPKAGVFSFLVGNAHPFDTGSLLDQLGIAVRTGHHCNQPLMDRLEIPGTVRASLALYNTREDVDRLVDALNKVRVMLI
ncbi:MAG TPA: cysteine desulfurase [Rhodothermales bacterium]|nr:cysteine desulfurase [Rhodothermales bacterium]